MTMKLSPRVYELAVAEVMDELYEFVGVGAPTDEDDVRQFAAQLVDKVTRVIYIGEKLSQSALFPVSENVVRAAADEVTKITGDWGNTFETTLDKVEDFRDDGYEPVIFATANFDKIVVLGGERDSASGSDGEGTTTPDQSGA